MPTLPLCGPCGPQWSISSIKHKEGSIYTVVFHGANVTRILWDVEQGCKDLASNQVDPTSSTFEIDLNGVNTDGKAYFKASCPNCEGYCNPFEFDVVHNNNVEQPLSAPEVVLQIDSPSSVKVNWSYSGANVEFEVQKSSDGNTWTGVGNFETGERTAIITGLTANSTHYFRIRTIRGDSVSEWSEVQSIALLSSGQTRRGRKTIIHGYGDLKSPAYNAAVNAGGVDVVVAKLHWITVERGQDNFNFDEIDYILHIAETDNVEIIFELRPFHPFPDCISGYTAHNKTGSTFSEIFIGGGNASYLPPQAWNKDRHGRYANDGWDLGLKGLWSYHNSYARARYLNFVAKVVDYANKHEKRSRVLGYIYIDGDFGETCISRQHTTKPGGPQVTDLGYSDDEMSAFRAFLSTKYGNIGALNGNWGSNYSNFSDIHAGSISKPSVYGTYFDYNQDNCTKDLFRFRLKTHREFYQQLCTIVKNPSSYQAGLSSNSGFETFSYNTENFTGSEGISTGTAMFKYLYDMFDNHISSCTAGNSTVNTASYYGDLVLRQQLYLGTFGQDGGAGFEMDLDPVENGAGPSEAMSILAPLGCKFFMMAIADTTEKWNRAVRGNDGVYRPLKDDLARCRTLFCNGQDVTIPPAQATIVYYDSDVVANANDPGGKKSEWIVASGLNATNGTMTTNVRLKNEANFV